MVNVVHLHGALGWAAGAHHTWLLGVTLPLRSGIALNPVLRRLVGKRKARPFSEYISFKETLAAARAAHLPVGEYIERKHLTAGKTALDQTMDGLAALGVFQGSIQRVCEIGPGSGRYLQRVLNLSQPALYEIYETSHEWRGWLVQQYGAVARRCDGRTLAETEPHSVDLVHAHKVFGGLPFLTTISYLCEMARVARPGGWVVFDIMTEPCFDREKLDAWFTANPWQWDWSPHLTAREYTIALLAQQELSLVGSFQVSLFPGTTECMVFRKGTGADLSGGSNGRQPG